LHDIRAADHEEIQLWDPFETLTIMRARSDTDDAHRNVVDRPPDVTKPDRVRSNDHISSEPSKTKPTSRKSTKQKKPRSPNDDVQLEIKIERSAEPEESDENSR
jgi:hypothetical protein